MLSVTPAFPVMPSQNVCCEKMLTESASSCIIIKTLTKEMDSTYLHQTSVRYHLIFIELEQT